MVIGDTDESESMRRIRRSILRRSMRRSISIWIKRSSMRRILVMDAGEVTR
jgi:hypothetical protein